MKFSEILTNEINQYDNVELNVLFFVDESSLFWVTKEGEYIWMYDHGGISVYVDEIHQIEKMRPTNKNVDGVDNEGVYWMNKDFNRPFNIYEFKKRISEINTTR